MKKLLVVLVAAALVMGLRPAQAQSPFAGKKIVIVTQTGSAIGGPAQKYGAEWAAANGATVEVQQFAFGDLFPKIITALQTKSGEFDVLIYA